VVDRVCLAVLLFADELADIALALAVIGRAGYGYYLLN
jgi:hypothetical protein